jgi:hypothetical protein
MPAVTPNEARDYVRFFFEVERDDHPFEQFEFRSSLKRKNLDESQKKRRTSPSPDSQPVEVWHLLPGNLTNFYRTNIPIDLTSPVIFSPYITMATKEEFPDVNEARLPDLVKEDTDAVYRLEATLDGNRLTPDRIADSAANVNIPGNNVFDLNSKPDAKVYFNGYFVKLQPLAAGDHLVESKGYSPHFEYDVRYSVYTRKNIS